MTPDRHLSPWLRGLAEKGGKGTVDNVDARALGRAADLIDRQAATISALREALPDDLADYLADRRGRGFCDPGVTPGKDDPC